MLVTSPIMKYTGKVINIGHKWNNPHVRTVRNNGTLSNQYKQTSEDDMNQATFPEASTQISMKKKSTVIAPRKMTHNTRSQ